MTSPLSEAVERWDRMISVFPEGYPEAESWDVLPLLDAARILLAGQPIHWCTRHDYGASHDKGRCHYSVMKLMQTHPQEVGPCHIVSKLLCDPPKGDS